MTKIEYLLTLQGDKFAGALSGVSGALGKSTSFLERHLGALAALGGVSVSVGGMVEGLRRALDYGGKLSDLSAQTGQTVSSLAVLQQAFVNAGLAAEQVGPAVNIMQKALAGISESGEPTNKIFRRLGLSMDELKKDSAQDALAKIGDKIRELPTAAERAEAAMKIFGKSGGQMLALLNDKNAVGDAVTMVGNQAEILGRNAAAFDRASDILGSIGTKARGFFVGVADKLLSSLSPLLEKFNAMDFSAWGQRAGAALNAAIGAFKAGELGALLGAAFNLAALKLEAPLLTAVNMAVAAFAAGIVAAAVEAGRLLRDAMLGISNKAMALTRGESLEAGANILSSKSKEYGERVKGGENLADIVQFRNVLGLQTGMTKEAETAVKSAVAEVGSYKEFLAKRQPGAQEPTQTNAESYISTVVGKLQELSGKQFAQVIVDPATIAKDAATSVAKIAAAALAGAKNAPAAQGADSSAVSAAEAKLAALGAKFQTKAANETGAPKGDQAGGDQTASAAGGKNKKAEVDNLTRVGLFVGGGSNAVAVDYLRRTTANTQKQNEIAAASLKAIEKLAERGITINLNEGYA